MPTTAIFRENWKVNHLSNKFVRGGSVEIWDANLRHNDVRPFACPELSCEGVGNLQTLYPLPDCKCLGYTDTRPLVKGFCAQQHFYLNSGRLRQANETELCNDEDPCLAGAPTTKSPPSVSGGCSGSSCDGVGVSYVITYVVNNSGLEIESAPSPASEIVPSNGIVPNATVSWAAAPAGYCVTATRLYRVETTYEDGTRGAAPMGAEFVLVSEFAGGGGGTFTDTVTSSETGYPLTTYSPSAFPAPPNLVGLARTTDGLVVADTNRVYISVAGQPQFTFDGVVEVEDEIRAIAAINNTIFVFTDNYPVKLSYQHTQNVMSVDKQVIKRRLPLTSVKSVSCYSDKIYFASEYSLYGWDISGYGSDIRSIGSNELFSPEQWKNMDPQTITGTAYEYGYIFSSDAMDYSLMIEFGQDGTDNAYVGTHVMPISYINAQAFATDQNGHIVYQQDGDVYCWDYRRTDCRDFQIADHVNPPKCDRCDCCPWTVWLYVDNEGKNRFTKMRVEFDERTDTVDLSFYRWRFGKTDLLVEDLDIVCSRGFSIPKYCSSQTFAAKLTSCAIMHEVRFATSNQELTNNSNTQIEAS